MSDKTGIEWTDSTWNPVTGCDKVSPGCDHCYAETVAHRFTGTKAYPDGFKVTLRQERLDQPLRWQRPRRIFVNSMSDLFHPDIPDGFIGSVFNTMALAERHTFQILTKRPGRMRSLLHKWETEPGGPMWRRDDSVWCGPPRVWPLPNVWLGVSAEDQKWADVRIPVLLDTPAAVRFISAEPLLGAINLQLPPQAPWVPLGWEGDYPTLDWIICGGESGPGARPIHPGWALWLRDQCQEAGVAFLFKQWGKWAPYTTGGVKLGDICMSPDGDTYTVDRDYICAHNESDGTWMRRVGKKTAGRTLDGRTWDEYPQPMEAPIT